MPEVLIRPNGKAYRPRGAVRAEHWCCHSCDASNVVVLGTHDADRATQLARRLHDEPESVRWDEPERTWWRLVPWGYEYDRTWIVDPARGTAAVVWPCGFCEAAS